MLYDKSKTSCFNYMNGESCLNPKPLMIGLSKTNLYKMYVLIDYKYIL